jgi:hypothetical protein
MLHSRPFRLHLLNSIEISEWIIKGSLGWKARKPHGHHISITLSLNAMSINQSQRCKWSLRYTARLPRVVFAMWGRWRDATLSHVLVRTTVSESSRLFALARDHPSSNIDHHQNNSPSTDKPSPTPHHRGTSSGGNRNEQHNKSESGSHGQQSQTSEATSRWRSVVDRDLLGLWWSVAWVSQSHAGSTT